MTQAESDAYLDAIEAELIKLRAQGWGPAEFAAALKGLLTDKMYECYVCHAPATKILESISVPLCDECWNKFPEMVKAYAAAKKGKA